MDYATVKWLHQCMAALSIAGFAARGAGSLLGARWVRHRAARTLPHVVDTVLLGAAIALAAMLRLSPLDAPWLLAKIGLLIVYIGLGVVALRPTQPRGRRIVAFVAALAVFGWIVGVAITKDPLGPLHLAIETVRAGV
ncbi:MAG: SirB2 family protein [Lautropia sp.]